MSEQTKEPQAKKGFGKKGLYIVIAVCVIAIAGILFVTMTPAEDSAAQQEQEEVSDVQSIESPTLQEQVEKEREEKEAAEKAAEEQAEREAAEKAAEEKAAEQAAKDEAAQQTVAENMQRAPIVIMRPLAGDIASVFQIDKLVFNSTLNIWQTHSGVDIVPSSSSEIAAALAGEVESVENDPTMGTYVTIAHSDNIKTKYAGLEECSVAAGDKVEKGDIIGICGTPPFEADMGPHLHFEVWDGTAPINPEEVFE